MVYFRRFDPDIWHRRSIRLQGHDYSSPGTYFITLLAADPDDFFGKIENGSMSLNDFGNLVQLTWNDLPNHNLHISLDAFIVMPDHVHGIIVIHDTGVVGADSVRVDSVRAGSKPAPAYHGLPEIIRQLKTFSARRINVMREMKGTPVWRRNYYEHIILSKAELSRVRQYIHHNPVRAGSKPAREDNPPPVRAGSKPAREDNPPPVRAGSKPAREDNPPPVRAGSKPAPLPIPAKPAPTMEIIGRLRVDGIPSTVTPIGSGHINDSYLVTVSKPGAGLEPTPTVGYVLQRINHQIFKDIPGLMNNIDLVTRHMREKIKCKGGFQTRPSSNPGQTRPSLNTKDRPQTHPCDIFLQVLEIIPTRDGQLFYSDPDGNFWRMYFHIPGSCSYDRIESADLAREGGRAFGRFQAMTAGVDPAKLTITIPRFHDITWRLEQFEEAVKGDAMNRVCTVIREIAFIRDHAQEMHTIKRLVESGQLPVRVTHNDTKFNNILFNAEDKAICIVDLDTVMPGTVLYDFGDAIRTGANTGAEDEVNLDNVGINMELFAAYAKGFLGEAGRGLTRNEIDHLAFSAKFMTFIIGLRFFTDHINGDTYYKVGFPGHNLQRARSQFKLLESMEKEFDTMREIVSELVN